MEGENSNFHDDENNVNDNDIWTVLFTKSVMNSEYWSTSIRIFLLFPCALLNTISHLAVIGNCLNEGYIINISIGVGFDVLSSLLYLFLSTYPHLFQLIQDATTSTSSAIASPMMAMTTTPTMTINWFLWVWAVWDLFVHVRALLSVTYSVHDLNQMKSVVQSATNNLRGKSGPYGIDHFFAYKDTAKHFVYLMASIGPGTCNGTGSTCPHGICRAVDNASFLFCIDQGRFLAMFIIIIPALFRIIFNNDDDDDDDVKNDTNTESDTVYLSNDLDDDNTQSSDTCGDFIGHIVTTTSTMTSLQTTSPSSTVTCESRNMQDLTGNKIVPSIVACPFFTSSSTTTTTMKRTQTQSLLYVCNCHVCQNQTLFRFATTYNNNLNICQLWFCTFEELLSKIDQVKGMKKL